jgi:Bacterial regulatory proteins, luxR family
MSVATVKAHVSRVLTKLDLNNRVQVALLVHDAGLASATGPWTFVHSEEDYSRKILHARQSRPSRATRFRLRPLRPAS